MDTAVHPTFTLTWAPEERIATVSVRCTHLRGEDSRAIIEALEGRIHAGGGDVEPFGLLGVAQPLVSADGGARAPWAPFFREHARTMRLGVVGIGPVLRVVMQMYSIGTGMAAKAFAREDEARAWLLGGDA